MRRRPNKMVIVRIPGGGLRITALEVRNLWGVAEAIIKPGQRNIIRGANGTGKTSLLNAIQLALGGGSLGKYARIGSSEEPEIVLEISGPSDFLRVERKGDDPPKVLRRVGNSQAFEKVTSPASFLKSLFDTKSSNPFAFLLASDDERAQLLLEALDLKMDEERLAAILGEDRKLVESVPESLHPLTRLALMHDAIYMARRGCNVEADSKRKSAEQLKRSVPFDEPADLSCALAELEQDLQNRAEVIAGEEARISAEHEALAASVRLETEKRVAEHEREVRTLIEKERAASEAIIDQARRGMEAARLEMSTAKDAVSADRERLATLRERHLESARHENTRKQIAQFASAADQHEAESERMTAVLSGIEGLKRSLASNLPIEGLDISGRDIKVNGVPWRDLNNGQQGAIAGVVAVERAKRSFLPIVFFDEAERFDEEHLDAIAKVVESAGAQLFAAVVAREGEISIEADGKPGGSVRLDAPPDAVTKKGH
jgi:hypothetical protein